MGGKAAVYAEKPEEVKIEFKADKERYVVKSPKIKDYASIPNWTELPIPPKTKKERDEFFKELTEKYGVSIYKKDGTKIEAPSDELLILAGQAIYQKALAKHATEETKKRLEIFKK